MRDRFPLLIAAALALFAVAGAYLVRGAARGGFAERLSTWRSEPDGARALYLLAEESGLRVRRQQADLQLIEEGAQLVLLGVSVVPAGLHPPAPASSAADGGTEEAQERVALAPVVGADELTRLLEHVAAGHTLIYLPPGDAFDPLLAQLDAQVVKTEDGDEPRMLVPALPSPWTLGVSEARAPLPGHLRLPASALPLLVAAESNQPVAALFPWGAGQIVVLTAPELAMNRRLGEADNAQLWLSLLRAAQGSGRLAFDEFHHGFTDERSIAAFAARYGLHFAILQLLLGAGLWAVALRRFGRPRFVEEEARIGATDALFAASRIYREGRHFAHAAGLIAQELSGELAAQVGLPSRAPPQEVAAALRTRGRDQAASVLEAVSRAAPLASSEHDVQRCARDAAQLRNTLRPTRSPA